MTPNPGRFSSDDARLKVLGRTARNIGDLGAAIRRELAAEIRRETDAR